MNWRWRAERVCYKGSPGRATASERRTQPVLFAVQFLLAPRHLMNCFGLAAHAGRLIHRDGTCTGIDGDLNAEG